MDIVLASGSPRRKEILTQMGLDFRVHAVDIDEHLDRPMDPWLLVEAISQEKAAACAALEGPDPLIIAADTVVVTKDGAILGKPRDEADAKRMLRLLSGTAHFVYTGFTVRRGERVLTDSSMTAMGFRSLSDAEIDDYVATGEPMDKAGAYGIQGKGAALVTILKGDFFNVMGLPIYGLAEALREFGVSLLGRG